MAGLAALLAACGAPPTAAPSPSAPASAAAPSAKPAASVEQVRIATATVSANQVAVWVADEARLWAKYGLDATVTPIQGSATTVAAILGGSIDVSQMGGPGLVDAGKQGAPVVMFAGFLNKEDYRLMADPSIKTMDDLRGKTVAVTGVGQADDVVLRRVLNEYKLQPGKDVQVTAVKDPAGQVAALTSRQVQAAVFGLPTYVIAQKQGAAVLLDLSQNSPLHQSTGLVASRDFLKTHHSVALKLIQATTDAERRFKNDKPFALSVMAKKIKTDDRDVLEAAWNANAKALADPPMPSAEGVQHVLDEVQGGSEHKPSEFIDTSFVEELQKQGWFSKPN